MLKIKKQLGHVLSTARQRKRHREWAKVLTTDWSQVLDRDREAWEEARKTARNGPKVLIATSVGGQGALTSLESLLAAALTLRGADVHVLLCDQFLPACMLATIDKYPNQEEFVLHGPKRHTCLSCYPAGQATFASLGLTEHRYSDYVTEEERGAARRHAAEIALADIPGFHLDGLAAGEHAYAGALRYFARGTLEAEPTAEPVLRRYFEASLLTLYATRRLLARYDFATASFNHGIYVPQGIIGEVARAQGLRISNWNTAYRKYCFIFSHGDTYHHTLMNEPVEAWESMPWTPHMEEEVMAYLQSRWFGSRDWVWFHDEPEHDLDEIAAELGIDLSKPTIGLLTNVIWDAQLHYPTNVFNNMVEWVMATIRYFATRPDLQLVIRVHPAEIRGTIPSRQRMVDEISRAFPALPANVFVIPPESQISTYAVTLKCDSVIIYGTKTGVELTSFGIPVIVAGEAWIRGKGVTEDAQSIEHYFQLLDALPRGRKLDEATLRRARMYAYHFFFRRMIPVPLLEPTGSWPPYELSAASIDELRPGAQPGLDIICEGILSGSPFVYPAEQLEAVVAEIA